MIGYSPNERPMKAFLTAATIAIAMVAVSDINVAYAFGDDER
jgi:hypothetical protein